MALTRAATNIGGPPLSIVVCSFLLKIPTKFIQSIRGNLPKNVTLRDGSNNLWEVKVEMEGGNWYFKDGLTEFINENKVEEGELLVYQYFSHGIFFDFKVHDRSTCQTKGVGVITRVQQVMADGGQCIPSNMEEGQRLDYFEAEEVTDSDDDTNGDDCIQEATPEKDQKRTREGCAGCSAKKGKRDLDWHGEQLFKSGLAQQPNNPYFVTKNSKRKNRDYELFVPGEVIKVFNLNLPETIVVVDEKGRKFPATRKTWSDGRTFYSRGWKRVCAANIVGDEDFCICEFVREAGTDLCIRVTFVPPQAQQP